MTIFGSRSRLLWSADYFYKLQIRLCQISIEVFFGAPGEANCYDKEKKLVWMLENNTKDNQKITFVPVSIKISFKLVSHFQKNVQMRAKMLSVYWFRPWLPTVLLDIGDEVVFITRLFASHEIQEIKFKLSLKSWAHDHTYSEAVFYHRKTDLRREAANLLLFYTSFRRFAQNRKRKMRNLATPIFLGKDIWSAYNSSFAWRKCLENTLASHHPSASCDFLDLNWVNVSNEFSRRILC